MWLLLVLQSYLHEIINLNTNVLKVFQNSLHLFLGCKVSKFLSFLRMQKVEILTSLASSTCMHTQNDSF